MPKMTPILSGKQVIKLLEDLGFLKVGQRGSHVKMRTILHQKRKTVIVPLHKELAPGTLASILKQAGLTINELLKP
ncbi:MAG TPA: addiction module toxin, HicA family [Firmicutes bacterium]|nr:addiction module toxin, HicA family [Bacillota bacterium]